MTTSAVYDLIPNYDNTQHTQYPQGDKPEETLIQAPTQLQTSGETLTSVDTTWGMVDGYHTHFILQRWRLNTDTAWTEIAQPDELDRAYTDSADLLQGQHVGYRIAANDGTNQSDWSPEAWTYVLSEVIEPPPGSAVIIDDFEAQPLGAKLDEMNSPPQGTGYWTEGLVGYGSSLTVLNGTGTKALHFGFAGTTDNYAWAEGRMQLGQTVQDFSMEFDLYIPDGNESYGGAAYKHRSVGQGTNNKFFRLWHSDNGYEGPGKIGASLWRVDDNTSELSLDFMLRGGGVWSVDSPRYNLITAATRGTWIKIRFDVIPSNSSRSTTITAFLNGSQVLTYTYNQYVDGMTPGFTEGYLLGWQNSGYTDDTILVLDNFRMTS